jgi:hypothetical protein
MLIKIPDAEDAKVTQKTQKRKNPFGISFAFSAKPLRLLRPEI